MWKKKENTIWNIICPRQRRQRLDRVQLKSGDSCFSKVEQMVLPNKIYVKCIYLTLKNIFLWIGKIYLVQLVEVRKNPIEVKNCFLCTELLQSKYHWMVKVLNAFGWIRKIADTPVTWKYCTAHDRLNFVYLTIKPKLVWWVQCTMYCEHTCTLFCVSSSTLLHSTVSYSQWP